MHATNAQVHVIQISALKCAGHPNLRILCYGNYLQDTLPILLFTTQRPEDQKVLTSRQLIKTK